MDAFDLIDLAPQDIKKNYDRNTSKDAFDEIEVQESWGKNLLRTLYQIPSGLGQAITYPLDLINMIGTGESYDPEEVEQLKMISEREGIPFDEEKYYGAIQAASEAFPTQGNIERGIENYTGLPLTPKTGFQKGLKLASTAGKITPGTLLQKGVASATAPAVSTGLQSVGVPEGLAEAGGLAVAGVAGTKSPKIDLSSSKKPSGLSNLRYEKLNKPTEVSRSKINKINSKVENEFRDITNKIIQESPIKETYQSLKSDPIFKKESQDLFGKVSDLSKEIEGTFSTSEVKNDLNKLVTTNKGMGFTPSEFDKNYNKFIKEYIKETPNQNATAQSLVEQFRKNNKALTEAYEPGQSFSYNRAKRAALGDYNKTIVSIIEKKYPDSEFSKLFKSSNKRWSEISDAESIDKFLDGLFKGEINFEKGRKFFNKEGMTVPFKRAMGSEGFAKFETLMGDLMSTEQASKLMKQAQAKGFEDLAKSATAYLIHPKVGAAKTGYQALKGGYNAIFEMLLDKPQLAVTWDRGINAMKAGNFKVAEKEFSKVKEAKTVFDKKEASRIEALRKFKEKKAEIPKKKELRVEFDEKAQSELNKPISPNSSEKEIIDMNYKYNPNLGRKELIHKKSSITELPNKETKEFLLKLRNGEDLPYKGDTYDNIFAIHKLDGGWSISHMPSGATFGNFKIKSKAEKALKEFYQKKLFDNKLIKSKDFQEASSGLKKNEMQEIIRSIQNEK